MVEGASRYTVVMTNLAETAAAYLQAKAEAKAANDRVSGLKKDLDALMQDGDEISVLGEAYRWVVSVGKSPSYGKLVDWLYEVCTPDVGVLIEEGKAKFTGTRTTKDLKPAE